MRDWLTLIKLDFVIEMMVPLISEWHLSPILLSTAFPQHRLQVLNDFKKETGKGIICNEHHLVLSCETELQKNTRAVLNILHIYIYIYIYDVFFLIITHLTKQMLFVF